MTKILLPLAAAALAAAPFCAEAQTYRCTAKDGKKYYGSAVPRQCMGVPVEQLNAQGIVVRRFDAEGEDKDKAAKAAAKMKSKEEDNAKKEESRRNRALLATYTSEKDIEDARRRALEDNNKAIVEVQATIDKSRKEQAKLEKELDFYQGKHKPPAKLTEELAGLKANIKAQEGLLVAKQKEVTIINAKYDDDKKRYMELKGGGGKK